MKTYIKRHGKQGLVILAILAISVGISMINKSATADSCTGSGLTAQILSDGQNGGGALAMFQNASDCSYDVGFASYGNSMFDSVTATIPAWQVIELHVSVPNCAYEIDAFRGSVLSSPNYGSNLLARATGKQGISCGPVATQTPTPTPTPVNTPTPTPGSNPTPTPTHTPTPTSGPSNRGPVGSFDGANCDVIGGWAYDPDSPSTAITVAIYDGLPTAAPLLWSGVTTGLRQDVNSALGITGNHGFTISTPASLKNGQTHQIYILGYDANTGNGSFFDGPKSFSCDAPATPTPTPAPAGNRAAIGSLDGVRCDIIGGWSYDPDTPNDITAVHMYYDGPAGSGKFLTDVWPNTPRPDVNSGLGITGTHGFTISTPSVLKDGNSHTVYAYAIDSDPSHSMNSQLQGSPKTIQCGSTSTPTPTPAPGNQLPIGNLDGARCDVIGGWAVDMDSSSSSITVSIYADGNLIATPTASGVRADVNSGLGITGNHGYTIATPASLKDGTIHNISAYGIDAQTGARSNLSGSPTSMNCPAPVANNPTPTPAYTPVPTPTPTQLVIPTFTPVAINFNSPCAYGASNSCNTTTNNTSTITNTSNITQNGNYNNAQVNQSGSVAQSGTGTATSGSPSQVNLAIPAAAPYVYNPTPTPYYYYPTPTPYYYYPTPTPVAGLAVQKYGRNVSRGETTNRTTVTARPGDTIQFDIVISANTNSTVSNLNVIDYLPAGLRYVSGSTALNGTAIADGIANSNGINIGYLYNGQQNTVRLYATVDAGARNGQTFTNNSSIRADNYGTINSNPVYVTVSGGVVAGALHVKTGPADWGMGFALMGSLSAAGVYLKRKGLVSLPRLV